MVVNSGAQLVREDLRAFAAALTELLDTRGMSRAELADLIDVSTSTVSNWTLGRARPTPANVEQIEAALGVPLGHLARNLGYIPVSEGPRPETLAEFLEREGLLSAGQQEIVVNVHDEFLRARAPRRGRPPRRDGQ